MLRNFLNYFFIPNLGSLGVNLSITKFVCVWAPNRSPQKSILYFSFLLLNSFFIIGIYTRVALEFSFDNLVYFFQYSAFHLGVMKTLSYVYRSKDWEKNLRLIEELENESTMNKTSEHANVVYRYRKYCQLVTFSFWIFCTPMVFFLMLFYWINYAIIPDLQNITETQLFKCYFCTLLPFNESSRTGRYLSAFLQTEFAFSSSIYTWTWDAMVLTSMVFLRGQLEALRVRCITALDEDDEKKCLENIVKCHKHYLSIIELVFIEVFSFYIETNCYIRLRMKFALISTVDYLN